MIEKERLDVRLVESGHFETREKAKAAVMAGLVRVNGSLLDKPGTKIKRTDLIEVKGALHPFVSRGGLKLEKAIREFQVPFADKTVIDIGASTGGFTDCALQHGASKVYAVDVGYGQLAWSLRQDPRVVVMERTNFRHLDPSLITEPIHIAVMDVSFISIRLMFPVLKRLLVPDGDLLSLVKPQFEAGREHVGKNGIVRDPAVHEAVLMNICKSALTVGLRIQALSFSPITGGDGNIEFLMHAKTPEQTPEGNLSEPPMPVGGQSEQPMPEELIESIRAVVSAAHSQLMEGRT